MDLAPLLQIMASCAFAKTAKPSAASPVANLHVRRYDVFHRSRDGTLQAGELHHWLRNQSSGTGPAAGTGGARDPAPRPGRQYALQDHPLLQYTVDFVQRDTTKYKSVHNPSLVSKVRVHK